MPPKKQTAAAASKRGADSEDSGSVVPDTARPRRAAATAAAKKIKLDEYSGGDFDQDFENATKKKSTLKRVATSKGDSPKKTAKSKKPRSDVRTKNGSSKDESGSSSEEHSDDEEEEKVADTKKGKSLAKKPARVAAASKKESVAAKPKVIKADESDEEDEEEEEEDVPPKAVPKKGKATKTTGKDSKAGKVKPKIEDVLSEDDSESDKVVKTKNGGKAAAKPAKTGKAIAAKKPKVVVTDSEDEGVESSEEETVAAKIVKPKKAAAKPAAAAKKAKPAVKSKGKTADSESVKDEKTDTKKVKTLIVKGKAPVDPLCTIADSAHVYCEGDDVFDATLNQTNIQHNNNKYYLLQLLQDDSGANYNVWFRWGRVGKDGQNKLEPHGGNLQAAKKSFMKKFLEKTKNDWDDRGSFQKVAGQYDLLQMDYNPDTASKDETDTKDEKRPAEIPDSKLDKSLQQLITLICNVKAMEDAVMEMQFDTDKSPLGKLTTDQIKAGYLALKAIEELVTQNVTSGAKLVQACNDFYTRIPHSFGMKSPPLINSAATIQQKIDLLEALGDIQVAIKMLNTALGEPENPVDNQYKGLDCQLIPLARDSETFGIIETYLKNSHEKTHNMYKLQIVDVFQCEKESEKDAFVNYGNRMLLWHGSRLTNWAGILKQGLRIAPPEAPVTGYMFGKGVYFADRCSKSANYCCTSPSKNTGLMLLCEVSLGNSNQLTDSDYSADRLPQGKNSVKGMGLNVPTESENITLPDGTIVPLGKSCVDKSAKSRSLLYNEYIVYRREQIKMRYLVQVKFVYGRS